MLFKDIVTHRQSIRGYRDKPVEREKIELCLEAARLAPSACNSQPWYFMIVDQPELRKQVAEHIIKGVVPINRWANQAPVLVIILTEKPKLVTQVGGFLKRKEYNLIDLGITAEHFCLQATELGLGTCMLGWFNEKGIKKALNIPTKKRIGLVITVGYHDENKDRKKIRKSMDEIREYL
ncbi:MAG: nitroreductase family protein [Candidatus Electrothrix aestuarii]|uniref:Nitroreductase family protein n=1 Tax=Candidatus Electrothrix aestuarii TaxID=3062594 RepID=A0AAU8LU82_9BACT|nr:nitroreductase family protein [Candidatus Electrothrix aestuarii]